MTFGGGEIDPEELYRSLADLGYTDQTIEGYLEALEGGDEEAAERLLERAEESEAEEAEEVEYFEEGEEEGLELPIDLPSWVVLEHDGGTFVKSYGTYVEALDFVREASARGVFVVIWNPETEGYDVVRDYGSDDAVDEVEDAA